MCLLFAQACACYKCISYTAAVVSCSGLLVMMITMITTMGLFNRLRLTEGHISRNSSKSSSNWCCRAFCLDVDWYGPWVDYYALRKASLIVRGTLRRREEILLLRADLYVHTCSIGISGLRSETELNTSETPSPLSPQEGRPTLD